MNVHGYYVLNMYQTPLSAGGNHSTSSLWRYWRCSSLDRLTKQAIFILTHDTITITSQELAQLLVIHVFSKHGISSHITSDCGVGFVSHFFQSLGKALNMKLHFTLGYHPEGDGQTECTNQTLEQYLRIYCNYQQDNWYELLALAEFAYKHRALPPTFHLSSLIRDTTQISQYTPNTTSPLPELKDSL